MPPRPTAAKPHHATSPFRLAPPPPPAEKYEVDDRVSHDKFGLGRVVSTEGDAWVNVRFGDEVYRVANGPKLAKL